MKSSFQKTNSNTKVFGLKNTTANTKTFGVKGTSSTRSSQAQGQPSQSVPKSQLER